MLAREYLEKGRNLAERIPYSVIALASRFAVADVFWRSGQTKVNGSARRRSICSARNTKCRFSHPSWRPFRCPSPMHARYRIERNGNSVPTVPLHGDGRFAQSRASQTQRDDPMFTRAKFLRLSGAAAAALAVATRGLAKSDDGVVRVKSAYGFQETIARLKKDIAAKSIKFFSEIDQSKLAADAGIKLNPSTLLVFGNPPLGTQFMTVESERGPRLAGAAFGHPGQRRRGVDSLHRLCLDRGAARHRQPRRSIQDGVDGDRLHHFERKA